MNYRLKNKIIEAICQNKYLFIKDTGIKVIVDYFGHDNLEFFRNRDKMQLCNIVLIDVPTTKALKFLSKYHIKKNCVTNKMELEGLIELKYLSLTPYESKAGKLLYEKQRK